MNENLDRVLVEKYTEVTYLASRLADLLEEFDSLVIKLAKKGVVLDPKEEAAYMRVLSTAALALIKLRRQILDAMKNEIVEAAIGP
ncbi:MAG: hypothetical protein QW324_05350 [Thermofilaceae archaeon]